MMKQMTLAYFLDALLKFQLRKRRKVDRREQNYLHSILKRTDKIFVCCSVIGRLGPSRSLLGALLEGTAGRMQCVLFRLANQNTSTANRGAK